MTKDTTGTTVMRVHDTETTIGVDEGWYEGTIQEYNVRKVRQLRSYPFAIGSDVVKAICDRRRHAAYGTGWGSGSMLFPVDHTDIAELDAETKRIEAEKAAHRAEQHTEQWRSPRGLTLSQEMDRKDTIY